MYYLKTYWIIVNVCLYQEFKLSSTIGQKKAYPIYENKYCIHTYIKA